MPSETNANFGGFPGCNTILVRQQTCGDSLDSVECKIKGKGQLNSSVQIGTLRER